MDYTIKEYYINGSDLSLEKKLKECFRRFVLKSRPLETLVGKTIAETFSLADSYFDKILHNNLCFYTENAKRFVTFGFGRKWLDEGYTSDEIIVMTMGASINSSIQETKETLNLLKKTFNILQSRKNWPILWNQNRQWRGKALSKTMEKLGAKKLEGNLWIWNNQQQTFK